MSLGEGRRAEEDNYTRKEMYSYRILLGCGIKNSRKKKVLMHFQLLESNKKFMLIYMTAGGKGEGSDGLVFIVDGARNKELTIIVIGSYKGSQKRK